MLFSVPHLSHLPQQIRARSGSRSGIVPARPELSTDDPRHWLPESPGHPIEYLGQGYISTVWGNGRLVVKITRERIPEAGIMPIQDDEKRYALTFATLWAIESLRDACATPRGLLSLVAKPVRERLAALLPDTWMPSPFVLIQEQRHGSDLMPQGTPVRARNGDRLYFEIASYLSTASVALPGVEIDLEVRGQHVHNGLHDGRELVAIYDPCGAYGWGHEWRPGDMVARRPRDAERDLLQRFTRHHSEETFGCETAPVEELGGTIVGKLPAGILVPSVANGTVFRVPSILWEPYLLHARALGFPVVDGREHPVGSRHWTLHCQNGALIRSTSGEVRVNLLPQMGTASQLIRRRIEEEGWSPGLLIPIAGTFAQKLGEPWTKESDRALLVANPKLGKAFVVHRFFSAYASALFPETDLRPLYELLGPPLGEEVQSPAGGLEQQFAEGRLSKRSGEPVHLELASIPPRARGSSPSSAHEGSLEHRRPLKAS